MAAYRFPKRMHLLSAREFERVFAARASAGDATVALYGAASAVGHPRLGLTVSRRLGGAVVRNRWKRLVREAFRLTQHQLPPLDLVCVARSPQPPTLRRLQEILPGFALRIETRLQQNSARPTH